MNGELPIVAGKDQCLIPLDIVRDILSMTKRIDMLRVYLYFNARSHGTLHLNAPVRKQAAHYLGVSERQIRKCMEWLVELDWIRCLHSGSHNYIIRGFRTLQARRKNPSYQCVAFNFETGLLQRKREFKGFLCGAHIGGTARRIKYIRKRKYGGAGGESPYGGNRLGSRPHLPSASASHCLLAADYIAKSLISEYRTGPIALSTAAEYRMLAAETDYISIRRHRREIKGKELAAMIFNEGPDFERLIKSRGRFLLDGIHGVKPINLIFRRMNIKNPERLKRRQARSAA